MNANSRREVVSKLTKLQRDISDGLSPDLESISLAQLLTRWHEDVLPRQVKESAQQNYWSVARIHLIPILGAKKLSPLTTLDVDALLTTKARQWETHESETSRPNPMRPLSMTAYELASI